MKNKSFKYIIYLSAILILFCLFIKPVNAQSLPGISLLNSFEILGREVTCASYPKTMEILNDIFKYMRIAAVVLFILLSSFDYITVIASDEKDGFKKANKHLVTRLIVLIAILILPSIINLLLTIIQLNNGNCVIK